MLIYQAICITHEPEVENSGEEIELLGLFSELEYAQNAFDRQERRESKVGNNKYYITQHRCFKGEHEVRECKLDAWREGMQAYWLFKDNSWIEYRIKK